MEVVEDQRSSKEEKKWFFCFFVFEELKLMAENGRKISEIGRYKNIVKYKRRI